jgi:hypothetical protein
MLLLLLLLLLSERDLTAQEFMETSQDKTVWKRHPKTEPITQTFLPRADRTFSQPSAMAQTEAAMLIWLRWST